MTLPVYYPALELWRDGYLDQRFYAICSLFDKNGDQSFFGEHNSYPFFLRSLMKPIQASIMADFKTAEFFNFTQPEIAIMQASHSGEEIHTSLVKSILNKIGLKEENLLCPPSLPLNSKALGGKEFGKIHNNCSAKHAMFLSICVQNNLPLNYADLDHPLQIAVKNKVEELSGFKNPPLAFDGCTLPVYALPFYNIAKAFFKLYKEEKYSFLKDAFIQNPYVIGGMADDGVRQDTLIMQLNPILISKTGAGGFIYVYNTKNDEFLLLKMAQDNNFARKLLVLKILEELSWIEKNCEDYNYYDQSGRIVGKFIVNKNGALENFKV